MTRFLVAGGVLCLALLAGAEVAHAQAIVDVIPDNPQNIQKQDIADVLIRIIRWLLMFAAAIGAIFVVVNGYQYILAAGNPEKIEKAKQGLTWSIIGFILVASSYGIVSLLETVLGARTRVRNQDLPGNLPSSQSVLEQVAEFLFLFGGTVAVLFLILGGYRYVTSQGNPELADKAKRTVLYSVIGLIVIFASVVIFNLVADSLRN